MSGKNNARILVVDDDEAFCRNVSQYLMEKCENDERYSYQVAYEIESARAIDRTREIKPHVVVLDHNFDGQAKNGFTILGELKDEFKQQLSDQKMALVYFSKNVPIEFAKELETEAIEKKIEEEDQLRYLIRLRAEYESSLMLKNDIDDLLKTVNPGWLECKGCGQCGLYINAVDEMIVVRKNGVDVPYNGTSKTTNILQHLAVTAPEYCSMKEIGQKYFTHTSAQAVVRYFGNIKLGNNPNLPADYLVFEDKSVKLSDKISCQCDAG